MIHRYDVCVVGGGPAGSAAATLLARHGRSVLLAEAGDYVRPRPGEHLAPDLIPALASLGASPPTRRSPGTVSLWGTAIPVIQSAIQQPLGGCITVRRGDFDRTLVEAAGGAGATLALLHRLEAVAPLRAGWSLGFRTPAGVREIAADLVIDASGRHLAFARRLGARIRRDDGLVALVGWTGVAPEAADVCRMLHVESVEGGWWYAIGLPDATVVAAYLTHLDRIRRRGLRYGTVWEGALAASALVVPTVGAERLRRVRPRVYPAAPALAEPVFGRDWLAVGDAAVQFDPLEGRGVRRALELAFRGAEAALVEEPERADVLPLYAQGVRAMLDDHRATRRRVYAEAADRLGAEFMADLEAYSR